MREYTAERCKKTGGYPRPYGYTIRQDPPTIQTQEDVEGVGLCNITPTVHHFHGWYRYKLDAQYQAMILNIASQKETPK